MYRGKVLLIVNTASKCGFTPQYDEAVCRQYRIRGQDEQRNAIFELRSMNPSLYPAIRSDELPITIIGKVVRIERRLP
jgi:phage repressor protein C with HTH and peptisase S24 domain